eukprot:3776040-Rhodomonas_salina.1
MACASSRLIPQAEFECRERKQALPRVGVLWRFSLRVLGSVRIANAEERRLNSCPECTKSTCCSKREGSAENERDH